MKSDPRTISQLDHKRKVGFYPRPFLLSAWCLMFKSVFYTVWWNAWWQVEEDKDEERRRRGKKKKEQNTLQ